MLQDIIECFAFVFFPVYIDFFKAAVFVQRHASVIKKVAVVYFVKSAFFQQETHMLLESFAVQKTCPETFYHFPFLRSQFIGVSRIHSRKIFFLQLIGFSFHHNGAFLQIHLIQKQSAAHIPFRIFLYQLAFQFKLNNGNGFVHLFVHFRIVIVIIFI